MTLTTSYYANDSGAGRIRVRAIVRGARRVKSMHYDYAAQDPHRVAVDGFLDAHNLRAVSIEETNSDPARGRTFVAVIA